MKVDRFSPSMTVELKAAYNAAVKGVPHCYPVGVEEIAGALEAARSEGSSSERIHGEMAYVAREGMDLTGFIHVGIGKGMEGKDPERGVIRFLSYRRGHRAAGQALLEAGEAYLRDRGMARVEAFQCEYRYPFYQLYWSCLSDRLDHVRGLLGINGYKAIKGEVFFHWSELDPVAPDLTDDGVEVSVAWEKGRGARGNVVVFAYRDKVEVGKCSCQSVGEYSRHKDAQDWAFVNSLNVADAEQGSGLGKVLLLRGLAEMRGAGYRHAVISANPDNHRAVLFYGNCGFKAVDWTYSFYRDLD